MVSDRDAAVNFHPFQLFVVFVNSQVLITEAYKVVRDQILRIINTNFGSGRLILLGGIQINLPHPYNDFFLPLMFQVKSSAPYAHSFPCKCAP